MASQTLYQIVEHIQSEKQHGSIVRDFITNQEFFVPGIFLDKEDEKGNIMLFSLDKNELEVIR